MKVQKYLSRQIEITKNNAAMFFEEYATSQALNLYNAKGLEALKEAINGVLNDPLTSAQQKLFFLEMKNKINL